MQYGDTKTVESVLPDFEESLERFKIVLLLQNVTQFPTDVIIKRKKICECRLVELSVKMTFSKKGYDCIHREMFSMIMEELKFEVRKGLQFVNILFIKRKKMHLECNLLEIF